MGRFYENAKEMTFMVLNLQPEISYDREMKRYDYRPHILNLESALIKAFEDGKKAQKFVCKASGVSCLKDN